MGRKSDGPASQEGSKGKNELAGNTSGMPGPRKRQYVELKRNTPKTPIERGSANLQDRSLQQLREHVVQIESLIVYSIICVVILSIIGTLSDLQGARLLRWLIPLLFLVFLRGILRVTNPASSTRNRLTWAAIFGGIAGMITGAVADIATGGLTLGQGTLIGLGAGAAIGGALGNQIEQLGKAKQLLERGDAFDYLYRHRKKVPTLSNPGQIEEVLDKRILSYDKNEDGRKWYSPDDLDDYVKKNSA